ncbi:MAG: Globin [uncultured Campylobacterales bacterium]|uniref:Globin n=1 Tax=uncultured Campylobacterales bacterium TaxID=352960 RepID=A0A6S6T5J4_9BACT|nr:MAG: Globin [uncultured Campylobacterales bacterium]
MTYQVTPYLPYRPEVKPASKEFLTILKEEGIRDLISDFYDNLIESEIKDLFPTGEGFEKAKQHSADFFIQYFGGPAYFNQNRGRPMMAARHSAFRITPSARLVWLECFKMSLEKITMDETIKQSFWDYIDIFSIWMVNTPE